MRWVINTLYAAWLGCSLAIAGIYISNWKYWLITVPTIILVAIRRESNENQNRFRN
jgi:hypothetical protein